jgi:tRNA dimethylallyltransferase
MQNSEMKENTEKKKIICLMGPTACGKTDLAIKLAQHFPLNIISVDSALVYRGMNIGTGKPSAAELSVAPHQLIDICEPTDNYSAGQFCVDVMREIEKVFSKNHVPLLVGGTMLYFNKLLFGLAQLPKADQIIRNDLEKEAEKIGWIAMHEKLRAIDPVAAKKIKPQDPQRISRALEVFLITGKSISELQKNNEKLLSDDQAVSIALIPADRAWLHERIAKRFEMMLENGLVDEVRALRERPDMHADLPSMRIVGYRQVWEYLDGKSDYETMKQRAIAATRQLAKRQMTWLRSWKNLIILDPQDPELVKKTYAAIN